ncbi:MAG TPA: zf-HC2 domain-containing protein [Caldimonas sp.]|nr:zf-HC2 domain-containing protein [Caldimonas sp.]
MSERGVSMNCAEAAAVLGAWCDGELAGDAAAALDAHVAGCAACRAEQAALVALRDQIRAQAPRHVAPPALRARIDAELGRAFAGARADAPAAPTTIAAQAKEAVLARVRTWTRDRQRWFAAGAFAGALLAVVVGALTGVVARHWGGDDVAVAAVENHVAATLGGHAIMVASSDRHQVKPWLSARLDYAAPVPELADSPFVLAGARVDRLGGRPVATLVYHYRLHVIDVFVRPLADAGDAPALTMVRGFTVARTTGAGMEWRAVADVEPPVLAAFVEQIAQTAAAQSPAGR